MKRRPHHPTLRQRIKANWSRRIQVVRSNGGWEVQHDGHMSSWTTSKRGREIDRERDIESATRKTMDMVADLRAQGFKVTLPS